jgi:hypothetical protein
MMNKVTIDFGSLCDPIGEQLEKQGLFLPEDDGQRIRELADAIDLLETHDTLLENVVLTSRRKVMREIYKAVKPKVTGRSL